MKIKSSLSTPPSYGRASPIQHIASDQTRCDFHFRHRLDTETAFSWRRPWRRLDLAGPVVSSFSVAGRLFHDRLPDCFSDMCAHCCCYVNSDPESCHGKNRADEASFGFLYGH